MLHGVIRDVPIWLDEGLAEYFELPPENEGVNPQHLEFIRRESYHPDLARLEKLEEVRQMGRPEYREAWAWVNALRWKDRAEKTAAYDHERQRLYVLVLAGRARRRERYSVHA